jgi:hypothetical protein
MLALHDLLHARTRNLEDERARERVLRVRMPFGQQAKERKIKLTEGSDFRNGSNSHADTPAASGSTCSKDEDSAHLIGGRLSYRLQNDKFGKTIFLRRKCK